MTRIYVNGRQYDVRSQVISYRALVQMAGFFAPGIELTQNPRVSYYVPKAKASGTLEDGDGIGVSEGLVVTVEHAGSA